MTDFSAWNQKPKLCNDQIRMSCHNRALKTVLYPESTQSSWHSSLESNRSDAQIGLEDFNIKQTAGFGYWSHETTICLSYKKPYAKIKLI